MPYAAADRSGDREHHEPDQRRHRNCMHRRPNRKICRTRARYRGDRRRTAETASGRPASAGNRASPPIADRDRVDARTSGAERPYQVERQPPENTSVDDLRNELQHGVRTGPASTIAGIGVVRDQRQRAAARPSASRVQPETDPAPTRRRLALIFQLSGERQPGLGPPDTRLAPSAPAPPAPEFDSGRSGPATAPSAPTRPDRSDGSDGAVTPPRGRRASCPGAPATHRPR